MFNIFLLGFSAGLPLALTGTALQAWFTVSGVDIVTIGALSLVGQPYIYKFIWAPLMDRFSFPFLGRRRGWICVTQILLMASIAGFAFLDPVKDSFLIGSLALLVAFLSASQDICVDAYRTEILKPEQRGIGSAFFANGYRIAMLISGGFALILADQFGWPVTYALMSATMLIGLIATFFSKEPEIPNQAPTSLKQITIESFKQLLSKNQIFLFLLLIVLYKLGDAFALSLINTFLLRGLGFSLTTIGAFYKTVGLVATLIGLLLGGWIMKRWALLQALFWFGLAQAFSNLAFVGLSLAGKNTWVLCSAITIESLCSGMGTAAFLALLMSLCDARYAATQFALLSALASIGRVFIGPVAAIIVKQIGWTNFYIWSFIISLPALFLIWGLRTSFVFSQKQYSEKQYAE